MENTHKELTQRQENILMLQLVAACHGVTLPSRQLHQCFTADKEYLDEADIRQTLEDAGLATHSIRPRLKKLATKPLPALAVMGEGQYVLLVGVQGERVLVQNPGQERPETISLEEFKQAWAGTLLLVAPGKVSATGGGNFGFHWFAATAWKYRNLMRDILLASLFIQIFALVSPLVFMVVVDKVLSHNSLATLDVLVIALATISLFDVILSSLRSYLLSHTNHRIDIELNSRFIKHLLSLPISYFDSRPTGDIVTRIRDLESVRQFITGPALTFVLDTLFIGIFLLVMFQFSERLTLIVLAILPVFFLVSLAFSPLLKRKLEDKFSKEAENQAFLVETLNNIRTIKGTATQDQTQAVWENRLADYIHAAFHSSQVNTAVSQTVSFLSKASVVLILWIGAQLVMEGELTVGQLIAFNMLSGRVNAPILRIAQIWQDFQGMRTSVKRLDQILGVASEPGFDADRTPLPRIQGDIRLDEVTFSYATDVPPALNRISLHIRPGETIGIVGPSGAGKSTLFQLLRRFYVADSGSIRIDGIDINQADTQWLRHQLASVSAQDTLLNRSVRENILLGAPEATQDEVVRAAQLANAHDLILSLPEGYDTQAGENGASLSNGQQQRILIARALISHPPILLLDEASNYLDRQAERAILTNLASLKRSTTLLIATHRPSMLSRCDRVFVMEQGAVVESGTLRELRTRASRFNHLLGLTVRKTEP